MRLYIACTVLTTFSILPFNANGFSQPSAWKNLKTVTSENDNRLEPLHVDTSSDSAVENDGFVPDLMDENEETLMELLTLPRHASNDNVNQILSATESTLRYLKMEARNGLENTDSSEEEPIISSDDTTSSSLIKENDPTDFYDGRVYANSYVDLGRVGKLHPFLKSIIVFLDIIMYWILLTILLLFFKNIFFLGTIHKIFFLTFQRLLVLIMIIHLLHTQMNSWNSFMIWR